MTEERRDRAYLTTDEVDTLGELTDTEIYEGELEAGVSDDLPGQPLADNLEMLTESELREGETADPNVAAEEGMTWVAPIDPPVVPDLDNPEGIQVAAGFGTEANEEPFDADHHTELLTAEDEFEARIREALRANSATSRYAEDIVIGTRGGTVVVRGIVDDIDDTDNVAEVVSEVTGVVEVVDELEVAGVTTE
jgi:hypothetical protein